MGNKISINRKNMFWRTAWHCYNRVSIITIQCQQFKIKFGQFIVSGIFTIT